MLRIERGQTIRIAQGETIPLMICVTDALGETASIASATVKIDDTTIACTVSGGAVSFTAPAIAIGLHAVTATIDGSQFSASIETVGSHYCSIEDIRNYGQLGNTDDFNDTQRYPSEAVFMARQSATLLMEDAMGARYTASKAVVDVQKGNYPVRFMNLPMVYVKSLSAEYNGSHVPCRLTGDCAVVFDTPLNTPATLTVEYGAPLPQELSRACVKLAADYLRPMNRPERATGESSDYGYISYTVAGRDGATGIPEVDAAIKRYSRVGAGVW